MKALEIVNQLKNRQGQHTKIAWQKVCKTLKSFDGIVSKRTVAHVRTGINYVNLAEVRAEIISGERDGVEPLPWGQWVKGFEKYIIEHKGTDYVRLYPATFANLVPQVEWTLNGKPASFAEVEPFLLASEKPKADEDKPLCFTVKAESVIAIG